MRRAQEVWKMVQNEVLEVLTIHVDVFLLTVITFHRIMKMIKISDVHFFLSVAILMVFILPEKTTCLGKIGSSSSCPKILSANQIALFFNIEYLQNGLIIWLHIFYSDLASRLEPTEQTLVTDGSWNFLQFVP